MWKEKMAVKLLNINAQFSTLSIIACSSICVTTGSIDYVPRCTETFGPPNYQLMATLRLPNNLSMLVMAKCHDYKQMTYMWPREEKTLMLLLLLLLLLHLSFFLSRFQTRLILLLFGEGEIVIVLSGWLLHSHGQSQVALFTCWLSGCLPVVLCMQKYK